MKKTWQKTKYRGTDTFVYTRSVDKYIEKVQKSRLRHKEEVEYHF